MAEKRCKNETQREPRLRKKRCRAAASMLKKRNGAEGVAIGYEIADVVLKGICRNTVTVPY